MCGSSFFVRRTRSNTDSKAFASAVLLLHRYQATPSRQVVIRVVGPGNDARIHKCVDFGFRDCRNKIPVSLQPLVAALDHHRAEYHLCLLVLESHAPVRTPPSEANRSSEPGIEAAQNCSGHTIELAGVS